MSKFTVLNDKLLEDFLDMVRIDSPSKDERGMADWLTAKFKELGCEVEEDDAGEKIGGAAGNLFVRLPGNTSDVKPLMFSAHMDTVEPARGIEPVVEDGIVRSRGETVLGSDDKAGIAVILQLARMALAQPDVPRPDLEFSIHIAEEIGLLGAKHVDTGKFKAIAGFILDDHDPKAVTIGSPSATRMTFKVIGKAAHAGVEPEKGYSAIKVASEAIARMNMGRIDPETTCNIGTINGGRASNIVTEEVVMAAEARSHSPEKLENQIQHMKDCFEETCAEWRVKSGEDVPKFVADVGEDYKATRFTNEDYVLRLADAAGKSLNWSMEKKVGGGGTDGSVLTHKGIPCLVIGVGMQDVHSTKEWIRMSDLEDAVRFAAALVASHVDGVE